MGVKRLLPLVAILLILGGIAMLTKRAAPPSKLADEAGLERLVPATVQAESITGIELYLGDRPQEAIRLQKRDSTWIVRSRFDAPSHTSKMQTLLTQLSTLQGEMRADAASLLGDFQLEEPQALHLKVYTNAPDKPAVYLLAGKGSGDNSFVRRAGETRVYQVNLNLRTTAGLAAGAAEQTLTAKPWLDLRLHNIPKEQVVAVELTSPTGSMRFTTSHTPTGDKTGTAATTPPTPASSWTLAAPPLAYQVKHEAVESLVTALRTVQGEDIADPAKADDYGLKEPFSRATLSVQPAGQEARQIVLLLGNEVPEQSGKRYARLGENGLVYILPQWTWQRLFPTLGTVLDLAVLHVPEHDVLRIAWEHDSGGGELVRQRAEAPATGTTPAPLTPWHFAAAPDVAVDTASVHTLLATATQLSAEDLLHASTAHTGLDQPVLTLTFTLRDGRTTRLLFGNPTGQDGKSQYVQRDTLPEVFLIPATTYQTLSTTLAKLAPSSAPAAPATSAKPSP